LSIVLFTGCVTAPVSFKVRAGASAALGGKQVAIAPPDVEVRAISAGGVTEKRDDWAETVSGNLTRELAGLTSYKPSPALDPETKKELADVAALMRAVSFNHLLYLGPPGPMSFSSRPLEYNLGPITKLADGCHADALLFVFARDAYSTGGRKALVVLGFAVPAPALITAALVSRDGSVQWFNYFFTQNVDLRTPDGARTVAAQVLAGLPNR
jgi:hypothetical protein